MFGFNTTTTNTATNATQPAGGFGGFGTAATTTQPSGGFGGFGTNTTTQSAGGFGAAATATQPTGGFGGFGTNTTTQSAGGFGAAAASTQPATGFGGFGGFGGGGFGAANTATTTSGFGGGFGARGLGTTTLGGGNTLSSNTTTTAVNAQNYPYPGIKGPGYSTAWSRSVDFAKLDDNTVFESLPEPLQQHLIELRTFMNAERSAGRAVYAALNETDKTTDSNSNNKGSYRLLTRRIAELQAGEPYAVAAVAVDCARQERAAQAMVQRMARFESDVRHYEQQVWTRLAEEKPWVTAGPTTTAGSSRTVGNGGTAAASQLLVDVVEELGQRMERVARQIDELALAVGPCAQGVTGNEGLSTRTTAVMNIADTIASVNAALGNELTTLMQLSSKAAKLHTRSDAARALFAQQYGQEEADAIYAPQKQSKEQDCNAGWLDNDAAAARREEYNNAITASLVPPTSQQQQQQQAAASSTPAAAPATTSAMQPFGAATTTAAPTTTTATASSNPFGGFGAAATTTMTPAAAATAVGFAPASAASATNTTTAATTTVPTFGFASSANTAGDNNKRQADATAATDDLRRSAQRVR